MNSHNGYTDEQLDSAVRTLDPADRHIDPMGHRAATDLEAILAAGPGDSAGVVSGRSRRRHRAGRPLRTPVCRAALVGAAAAVLALAVVAVPTLKPDGDQGFTSWAAVPEPLAPEQLPEAGEKCREAFRDGPGDYAAYLDRAGVAVAERRGDWVTVVLSGDDGFTATCITDASARLTSSGMIGSIGASAEVRPDLRELRPTSMGLGAVSDEELSMLVGYSGAEVTGVTYSSHMHGEVVATVAEERFALWMPGAELRDAHRDGVDVEVTYADGTTEQVHLGY